ncbi:MAG: T9SS type A sorting domain-containing protein, partial [Flavobacteriales bacterium]|nr:T9SS type A sorting domain-containing protein [Flavobacteriales bacterium]
LTAGQTVYIRYWERNNNEAGTFQICAFEPIRPTNDQPCTATPLPTPATCTPLAQATNNAVATTGITVAAPSCGVPATPAYMGGDLWYAVTVPSPPNMTVRLTSGTLTDMAMAWYRLSSGTICGPPSPSGTLTEIACAASSGADPMPSINNQNIGLTLTAGETIYVRVWSETIHYGTFSICATQNFPPPNDDPCNAIDLEVDSDCLLLSTSNDNATNTANAFPGGTITGGPSCGAPVLSDVWFTVDVPSDLITPYGIEITTDDGGLADAVMAVYRVNSGDCGTSNLNLQQIGGACSLGGSTLGAAMPTLTLNVPTITPGERLYVRVWRQSGSNGTFAICARRTDPTPCAGTVYDPGGPSANYANNLPGTAGTNSLFTYCASKPGDVVSLDFIFLDIENGWDFLTIYNGPTTAYPIIGTYTGTTSPGTISATLAGGNTNGCLTLRFTSDGIINATGWAAKLYCSPPVANTVVGDCGLTVYDPGGPSAPYPNNIGNLGNPVWTQTYCPNTPGDVVTLTFSSFNVEANFDALYVFNDDAAVFGNIISSGSGAHFGPNPFPSGGFWGNGVIGPFQASITAANPNGCITLVFVSDISITPAGWTAQVTCGPPAPPGPPPITGGNGPIITNGCGAIITDTGGSSNPYSNIEDWTRTICPAVPGEVVSLTFQSFGVETGFGAGTCFDMLYVHDGNSTAAPIFNSGYTALAWPPFNPYGDGGWCGNSNPGPFTSTAANGCLTLRFWSDNIVTSSGWRALISCQAPPPNDNPCTPTGAILLPVETSCNLQTFNNNIASDSPSIPSPGCGNYQGGDVWFRFVAPANGRVFIDSRAGTLTDGAMALYSAASCSGPFTLIECDDDDGQSLMPTIDRLCNTLTPGATYWLRFWGYNGDEGTFDLCITTTLSQTSQSDCIGAFSLCSDVSFSNVGYGQGCSEDLSAVNWGCLGTGEHQGSWYAFAVENAGTLGMTIVPSAPADIDWAIWEGTGPAAPGAIAASCIPAGPPIRCSYGSLYNTTTAGGSATTGMGNASMALNNPQFNNPTPNLTDNTDGWVPGINVAPGQVYLLFVDDHHLSGIPYTVNWQATPSVPGNSVMDCVLLPVELLDLVAHPRTRSVDLTWTTASETNSSHFIVERSADGERFEAIGSVNAMGYTQSLTEYAFTDERPLTGVNYYRLTQVDQDGTTALSNTVSAHFKTTSDVKVIPNPTRESAELVFTEPQEELLLLRITDSGGRVVGETRSTEGMQRVELPIAGLERGTYFVRITTLKGAPRGVAPFVKQ